MFPLCVESRMRLCSHYAWRVVWGCVSTMRGESYEAMFPLCAESHIITRMCFHESASEENNWIISETVARNMDETERQYDECYPIGGKLFEPVLVD